jgi:hypothetical protein
MNFILDTQFQFNPQRKIPTILSEKFVHGRTYKLNYVKILQEENKIEYSFIDLFNNNNIKMKFANTSEGDDFIANVSGKTHELEQTRKNYNEYITSGN